MFAAKTNEISAPPRIRFMLLTLALALFLNLLPFKGWLLLIRPDFVLLCVLYWAIYQPRLMGIGVAWMIGLLMDIAHAGIFGQYPMAYAAAVFLAIILQRRILRFIGWQQAIHIFVLLLSSQLVVIAIQLFSGAYFVGWGYFVGSILGALLWPVICASLQLWQRRRVKSRDL